MNTPSSSPLVVIALAAAAVAVVVSGVSYSEVRGVRADIEALKAGVATRPAAATTERAPSAIAEPAVSTIPPLDLSPWNTLPATKPVLIPRAALENTTELAQSMRVVPAFEQGVTIGFKIFSVRQGSLFAQLGVENGDIVVALNDLPIATPEQALAVADQLRTSKTAKISIRRRGEPVRIDVVFE